ncbi:hypothetical protein CVT26_008408, partial [Gymnopilus dilepis]
MAAPATYIRTIHSSLTSASAHHSHHSSSAWASASATAQYHLNHGHHNHHPNHLHTISSPSSLASLSLASPSLGTPPPPPGLVTGGHPLPYHLQSPRAAHNQVNYNAQGLMHTPSISTHNAHMYTHHLRDLTHPHPTTSSHHRAAGAQGPSALSSNQYDGAVLPTHDSHGPAHAQGTMGAGAGAPRRNPPSPPPNTRRRSSSVRMPPSYRFDPFGDVDEPSSLALDGGAGGGAAGFASSGGGGGGVSLFGSSPSVTAGGPVASQAVAALPSEAPEAPAQVQPQATEEVDAAEQDQEQEDDIASLAPYVQPYTIQIPPAAPLEIEQYTTQPS